MKTATALPEVQPRATRSTVPIPTKADGRRATTSNASQTADRRTPCGLRSTGFTAADVEAVVLLTDLDRHKARVQSDGSFLTLVRAHRGSAPRSGGL